MREDEKGYANLKLQKADGPEKEITSQSKKEKNALFRIASHYQLCQN
jgi:DNA polymerase-3 subunit epsilon